MAQKEDDRKKVWGIPVGDGTGGDAIRANKQFHATQAASLKREIEESLQRRLAKRSR